LGRFGQSVFQQQWPWAIGENTRAESAAIIRRQLYRVVETVRSDGAKLCAARWCRCPRSVDDLTRARGRIGLNPSRQFSRRNA